MNYIVIVILIVLFVYNQFGKEIKDKILSQKTSSFENGLKQERQILGTNKKINSKDYNRFILTKNTTENYITNAIREFGELSGNVEYNIYNFGITEEGDWKIIKIDEAINFYVYHNLVGWLNGYEENYEIPELSIGFAKSKTDSQQDYLFFLDPENNFGDTQIGAFKNGKSFSIYLPDAYEEYGNLTVKSNIKFSMKDYINFISKNGFDIDKLMSLNFTSHKIKMNE